MTLPGNPWSAGGPAPTCLYGNWLNYCVYQTTPYDIGGIRHGVRTDD